MSLGSVAIQVVSVCRGDRPVTPTRAGNGACPNKPSKTERYPVDLPPVALCQRPGYNVSHSRAGAVSSAVRAPRSHRGGRRFKSSIAHQPLPPRRPTINNAKPPCRGGETADALRSGRSVHYGRVGSNPSLGTIHFSSRACSSVDRALPCGGRGREFESRQARHFFSLPLPHGPGRLAQMVRASALHAEGRGFESLTAHHQPSPQSD